MPWKSQGEKRKCEERKGTGSREREKEKDGNGKDGRIYPLEDIWDYLSIGVLWHALDFCHKLCDNDAEVLLKEMEL